MSNNSAPPTISIIYKPDDFADWQALLNLLQDSFAFMQERIDPPSSMHRLGFTELVQKSCEEQLILALDGGTLVGCLFAKRVPDSVYIGKIAVAVGYRRRGVAKRLVDEAQCFARRHNRAALELQVRIELTENQAAFAHLGFVKVAETAHQGYAHATSITMRKSLV